LRKALVQSIGRGDFREDDGMRMSITVLTAVAALLLPIQSKADSVPQVSARFHEV